MGWPLVKCIIAVIYLFKYFGTTAKRTAKEKADESPRRPMLLTVIAVPGCTVRVLYHIDAFAQIS